MAGRSEHPTDVGELRLQPAFAPSACVGIDVPFLDIVDSPVEVLVVELSVIRLIATTCESDFILCCGSVDSDIPTKGVSELVEEVVLESGNVFFVGTIVVLSTIGGLGVFGLYGGCCDGDGDALLGGNCCCCCCDNSLY